MPGGRQWINDEANRTPGGSYVFGGLSSPDRSGSNTPSFLKKKKKPEPYPPAKWGTETASGSYFTPDAPQSHSRNMTWDGGNSSSNNFATKFDPDYPTATQTHRPQYSWTGPGADSYNSRSPVNPFTSSQNSTGNQASSNYGAKSDNTPYNGQRRATSANYNNRSLLDESEGEEDIWLSSGPAAAQPTSSTSPKPFIQPREELTRPLHPHEGIARAIALFDFNAVEVFDTFFFGGSLSTDFFSLLGW